MVFKNRLSIQFSGSQAGSGYINVPNPNTTLVVGQSGTGVSYSLWFNYPVASSGTFGMCGFGSGGSVAKHMQPYLSSGGGQMNCDFRFIAAATDFAGFSVTNTIAGTGWHHLVTSNSSGGGSQIYLDGIQKINDANHDSLSATSGLNFQMGNVYGGLDPFIGMISDVRIYNTQLTQAQVTSLFNDQDVRPGLVARFDMTEGAGTTTTDSVGGFVGTLVSSKPQWNLSGIPIPFTTHGSSVYSTTKAGLVTANNMNRPQPPTFSTQ